MAYICFDKVGKDYISGEVTVNALKGVSFEIEKGEICVIVGESGAGKTTLLNILGGMDVLSSGRITVDGTEISAFKKRELTRYRRNDVGFVFQFYNLIPNLTAIENVEIARALVKNPKLLLCDEPTGALDYITGKAILKLLQDTARNTGMTVVIITHNKALTAMADRVIRLKSGTVTECFLNENIIPVENIEW